ncbi:hypothetical protein C0995_003128 [Termitomyces sp. Mi166|nr:hypothetical protein C0995_003128 [Termitomyces sp. Mi166\
MSVSPLQVVVGLTTAWIIKFLLQKYLAIKSVESQLQGCPGKSVVWLNPFRTLALVFGPYFPFKGQMGYYFADFSLFQKYGSTCLSSVTFRNAIPTFWLSDADAIKAVHFGRAAFQKDVEAYETINIYGPNMVGTEGAEWKRHRHVANSAFNEANNAFVWCETTRVINEWFMEIDSSKPLSRGKFSIDLMKDLTKVTLLVIASAGFGRRATFKEDSKEDPPPGHKVAFRLAIISTIRHVITKAITPKFLWNISDRVNIPLITPLLNECRESFVALGLHMHEVIASARDLIATGKNASMESALLRNMVQANMVIDTTDTGKHLSDDDLLSNTFASPLSFLFSNTETDVTPGPAETSAHTLCFTIVLLALYPDVQQKVFEEVCQLWPAGIPPLNSPTEFTLAVFHETLRLFPPVVRLAKNVHADSTLVVRRFDVNNEGKIQNVEKYDVTVRRGSLVVIDIRALHFNPIHWGDDVEEFRPSRFIDTNTYRWPRDAFNAFSGGPRSCIGQRFSLTESACILAHVVRKYEVHVPDDLKNKPWAVQKKILLDWTPGITATPTNARVTFRCRST